MNVFLHNRLLLNGILLLPCVPSFLIFPQLLFYLCQLYLYTYKIFRTEVASLNDRTLFNRKTWPSNVTMMQNVICY